MRLYLCIVVLIAAMFSLAKAQSASDGNDFYLGLLYPSYNTISSYSSRYAVVALVSSLEDNTISVSYFDPITGIEEIPTTYTVKAFNSISIPLNIQKMRSAQSEVSEYRSVHIKGKKKISVQYFSSGASSGGAYLGLPVNVLGKKYVIASYNDNPDRTGALIGGEAPSVYDKGCGEFIVIGTKNGTTATITMRSESEGGINAGETRTISLNRGQSYHVRSKCNSSDDDITGSIVESDHPVAVISGHSNASLGGVGEYAVEARDFMVEQMLPVEYWDTTGYASVPFPNTFPSSSDGAGDEFRVCAFDPRQHLVTMKHTIGTTSFDLLTSRLHPNQKLNAEGGYSFSGTKGIPYMVYQYDQASHGSRKPYPRPSMTQLMSKSRYRSMFHFTVPQKTFELDQEDYIFIAGSIYNVTLRKNGGAAHPIEASGFKKIHTTNYFGTLYQVQPGSYVIASTYSPIMIYQYGFRMMSADVEVEDYDGDDNITSYAMPAGVQLPFTDTTDITYTIEETCSGWNVCVTDNQIEGGIYAVVLMNDPYGDIFPYDPSERGPYLYNNVSIEENLDPNNTGEIVFTEQPEKVCFKVTINNHAKNAYAPLYILNSRGKGKIVELYKNKRIVQFRPDSLMEEYYPSYFGKQLIRRSVDSAVMVINHPQSGQNVPIQSVTLRKGKTFSIASLSRAVPALLVPGDTMKVTLRFNPQDTGYYSDTLSITSDCFTKTYIPNGNGAVGLIAAADHNFGKLHVGKKSCWDTISVRNIGQLPFTLKENYVLTDTVNFSFDPHMVRVGNRNYPLPLVIPADGFVKLYVCYHPTTEAEHNTELILQTDIPSPYSTKPKNIIKLKGTGISPTNVIEELQLEELSIYPNPTLGEDITASFGLTEPKELGFAVYDMLGREVLSARSSYYAKGKHSVMLPVSKLSEGGHILRVSDGVLTKSISFRVQ